MVDEFYQDHFWHPSEREGVEDAAASLLHQADLSLDLRDVLLGSRPVDGDDMDKAAEWLELVIH